MQLFLGEKMHFLQLGKIIANYALQAKKKWHVIEKSVVSHNTFFVSERVLTILLDILRGYGVFGQHDKPFDYVAQLADVAAPTLFG